MIGNEAGLGFEPCVCDSEAHCLSIIMGSDTMEVESMSNLCSMQQYMEITETTAKHHI